MSESRSDKRNPLATDGDFHRQLVESMSEGVYVVTRSRRITYWNPAAERITGYASNEIVGRNCFANILNHVDDAGKSLCRGHCPLSAAMRDGQPHETLVYLRHRDGHRVPVRVKTAPIRDARGVVVGGVELFDDATTLLRARDEANGLRQQALTDPLTGLANRRHAEAFLEARLDSLERHGWPVGLLIVDVDHFKRVNDRHGHDAGDSALRVVAGTLRSAIRGEDLAARWGGDEFVVVVTNPQGTALLVAAERVRRLVARSRVRHGDLDIAVAVSVGGAMGRPGDTAASIFARADGALYRAKAAGRNRTSLVVEDGAASGPPASNAAGTGPASAAPGADAVTGRGAPGEPPVTSSANDGSAACDRPGERS